MPVAHLRDRGVIEVAGEEGRAFLDRLLTCDLDRLAPGRARYGALLAPQGKIVTDMFVLDATDGSGPRLLLDVPASRAAELLKRLATYRLRAKIGLRDASSDWAVLAGWGESAEPGHGIAVPDPRLPALGWRALVPRDGLQDAGSPDAGEAARIGHLVALGVPEGGRDFAFDDAFPHEALMDQLGGVDFNKGCYVGQEVVSRMQHRGTARTRLVPVRYEAAPPPAGTDVILGRTGSRAGTAGFATIRLDRAADALAAGDAIAAGGRHARFAKPGWVRFRYPDETEETA